MAKLFDRFHVPHSSRPAAPPLPRSDTRTLVEKPSRSTPPPIKAGAPAPWLTRQPLQAKSPRIK